MARSSAVESLPQLFTPAEVASVLGCSEWWVKEQARRRRIPFTKPGGAYKFTHDHLYEIIRIFEQRPNHGNTTNTDATSQRRRIPDQPTTPVVQLRARRPRRLRNIG